jgi:Flp pilus assembly pilin Flp
MSDLLTSARVNCSLAFETFCREARRLRKETGQTAAEYMGVLLVVSVIIAAVAGTGIGDTIGKKFDTLVSAIAIGEDGKTAVEKQDAACAKDPKAKGC